MGSKGVKSFDCSGFTSFVFGYFGYKIGVNCISQVQQGMKVMLDELQTGDLVFLRTQREIKQNRSCGNCNILNWRNLVNNDAKK
ncbi:MAG: C40 family peptidase [Prevotellaceae bacterium]|nr:C40 family peptidase [Prevotellaceae bacterium]